MSEWSAGYMKDINYTYGYYRELNPNHIKIPFLISNRKFPSIKTACELGFGQGISIAAHSSASNIEWYGTDFNAAQTAFAQELVKTSSNPAKLFDQSFAEFCSRDDLPDFDYIALHGIWSWISDENRTIIVDFLKRKLKAGGVLYISYNTQPGWAQMVPMRDLLNQYVESMTCKGHSIEKRIDESLAFAERLFETNPQFIKNNPAIQKRIEAIKNQNKNYIAHEYFNKNWHPMSFADISQWLFDAKLNFVCSANHLNLIETINFSPEQQQLLKETSDPILKQSMIDFIWDTQFRRDYWVKGEQEFESIDLVDKLLEQTIVLVTQKDKVTLTAEGKLGTVNLHHDIYEPILERLKDNLPHTIKDLQKYLPDISLISLLQAVTMLIAKGNVEIVQSGVTKEIENKTNELNLKIMKLNRAENKVSYLASPLTGGAIGVPRFEQIFLLAQRESGKKNLSIEETVKFAWTVLQSQGQKLVKEGVPLETTEANIEELTFLVTQFFSERLPILKALKIA